MVKEIGRTKEEKQAIGRMKMLEEIAKEVCKKKYIDSVIEYIFIRDSKNQVAEISVLSNKNEVRIDNPKHEVDAYNLALAYEIYDGEQWILRKEY